MKEIWKDIEGFEGVYQISNCGNVKSLKRHIENNRGTKSKIKERIIVNNLSNAGYWQVTLSYNGLRKMVRVHRLIAKAFIPNPENKPHINHKNGIKDDNRIDNLEWCTHKENIRHAYENALFEPLKGEQVGMSKLNENQVLQIRSVYSQGWFNQTEIAYAYGLDPSTVNSLVNNKTWKHI